jgi:hypothetical protein
MATPISPFSELLAPNNYERDDVTINNANRFTVSFVSAPSTFTSGSQAARGLTASGLYGLMKLAYDTQSPETGYTIVAASGNNVNDHDILFDIRGIIIKTPEAFIGLLNNIHNNANLLARSMLPFPGTLGTNPGQYSYGYTLLQSIIDANESGFGSRLGTVPSQYSGKNAYEFVTKYFLPNTYTGNTGGELLTYLGEDSVGEFDYSGNGITGAFVVYDSEDGQYKLSRTGIEAYTVLQLLAYGCTVRLCDNYSFASEYLSFPSFNEGGYLSKAVITLDMSTYLEGQGITSGANIGILGSLAGSYSSGNTYNFCHGSSGLNINGIYGNIVNRNNPINAVLDSNNASIDNVLLIHAGLSGYSTSLNQNTNGNPDTFIDVDRYPGLNGLTSSYQYQLGVAGLTAYRLTSTQLKNTFCIMGKKTKTITSTSFGDSNGKFIAEVPLVADVAGALARAYRAGDLYIGAAGAGINKKILNADSVTPLISNNATALQNNLKTKRINYYSPDANGIYLASDFVGATGPVQNLYRLGVQAVANDFTTALQSSLTSFVGEENTQNTRNNIRNYITGTFFTNLSTNYPNIAKALDYSTSGKRPQDGQNVVCDASNQTSDTTVTVTVKIYPKPIQTGADSANPIIGSISVTVQVGD